MEIDKNLVGKRINGIRKENGLSMEKFGSLIDGASKGLVNNWEKGVNLPNNKRIKLIATLGRISVNELLYGDLSNYIHSLAYDYKKNLDNTYFKESLNWGLNEQFEQLVNTLVSRVKEKHLSYEDKDTILQELESLITIYFGDFVNYNPDEFSDNFERSMGKHIDGLQKTSLLYPEENDQEKYSKWIEIIEKSIQEVKAIDEN